MINKPQNYYPDTFRQVEGKENLIIRKLSHEPKDEINKELLFEILSESNIPLNRRELQKELNSRYKRYQELGTLCIPLIVLERENKISWIKLNCTITGNKCKHYFHLPSKLPLGTYWDWDTESQKLVIRGNNLNGE